MTNKKKGTILTFIIFCIAILILGVVLTKETKEITPTQIGEPGTQVDNSDYKKKNEDDKTIKLDKEIQYVQVKEINSDSLKSRPIGGISSQQSIYYEDDNLLYLFYDAEVPTKDTNMVVTYEKFDKDYLLDYDLINAKENKISLDTKVNGELIKNKRKLILDENRLIKEMTIKNYGEEIKIVINGKEKTVKSGETKEFNFTNKEVESRLVVSNHKLKDGNIVYQEPNEEMKKELQKLKK